jgi:hypothetical protein
MAKLIHPITFIDKLVKKNELGQPFTLSDHQREILRLAFDFDQDGRLPWDTILYSCIKKSGKTTLNGAITLAWVNSKKEKTIMDQSEIYREQRKRDDDSRGGAAAHAATGGLQA